MSRMGSENTTEHATVLRLVNLYSGHLSEHNYDDAPPYVAVSHTWRANLFPRTTPFVQTSGRRAVLVVVQKYFPNLSHCWVDTFCIKQDDEQDKQRQIPMMGEIYHGAVAVTVALASKLIISQEEIDTLSEKLEGACFIAANETWREDGLYWGNGPGKEIIIKAMNRLEIFTRDEWACRIRTLQEFVLARSIVRIGSDYIPLRVREILFSAIPSICDTLNISECIGRKYTRLYSYFSGMMNCKLRGIDRTRIMELLGNRSATVPADEIYGAMAASGVIIDLSDPNHSRYGASGASKPSGMVISIGHYCRRMFLLNMGQTHLLGGSVCYQTFTCAIKVRRDRLWTQLSLLAQFPSMLIMAR